MHLHLQYDYYRSASPWPKVSSNSVVKEKCPSIWKTIQRSRVTILVAPTGSGSFACLDHFLLPTSTDFCRIWWRIRGKSTDLPQLLLAETQQSDAAAKILCAQPRRIGATTLASYVSKRTKTGLGGENMGIRTCKTLSAFLWRVWRSSSFSASQLSW